MSYPVKLSSISRRTFTRLCCATLSVLPVRAISAPMRDGISGTFSIDLELKSAASSNGRIPFVIRIVGPDGMPAPLKSLQVFAPGDSKPLKARFDLGGGSVRQVYAGQLHIELSQHVMALAEFADGKLVHDRRYVSLPV